MKTKKEIQTGSCSPTGGAMILKRRLFTGAVCLLSALSLLSCSHGDGKEPYFDDIIVPVPGEPNCSDPIQPSGFHAGLGTRDRPYLICSYEQFNLIRDDMNVYYAFGQDIDARPSWSEHRNTNPCTPFDGSSVAGTDPCDGFWGFPGSFWGGLDGRGYALRNLYSNIAPPTAAGSSGIIFQDTIELDAYIYNLGIIDPRVRFGEDGAILGRKLQGVLQIAISS